MTDEQRRQGRGRGAQRRWEPDRDSAELLDRYRAQRRATSPKLVEATIRAELGYLRAMVRRARDASGPEVLRALRDSPQWTLRVLLEGVERKSTRKGMLAAMLHLIELTVRPQSRAAQLRAAVIAGLRPRPRDRRPFNILPRTAGGRTKIDRDRPVLGPADLDRLVRAAAKGSPSPATAQRDTALVALRCYSAVMAGELTQLNWHQVTWEEPTPEAPWCARIHGVGRRGQTLCLPVLDSAAPYLRALAADTGRQPEGPLLRSTTRQAAPVSSSTVYLTLRRAARDAELDGCDEVALKRAFASLLKLRGLSEYQIRDALGVRSTRSVDRVLRHHRRAAAQRVAAEHRVTFEERGDQDDEQLALGIDNG